MGTISIGKKITTMARQLRMLRNRCLKETGCEVGAAYFHIFKYFTEHPGCTEKQAAEAMENDKTYVAKAVKKLIAQGMVISKKDDRDARYKRIWPTQKGKDETIKVRQALQGITDTMVRGIDPSCIEMFLDTLNRMQNNVLERLEKR